MITIDLTGKRALVCGSSAGIGLAIAQSLAECGASVTLFARDSSRLKAALETLPVHNSAQHSTLVADFNQLSEVESALDSYLKQQPITHILVNNSGGPPPGEIQSATVEQFQLAFNRLLMTSQIITQKLLPGMRETRYGRILNVISLSVKEPIPGLGVSNTIRAATAAWSKTLSREIASDGITINSLLPGYTATERLTELFNHRARQQATTPDAIAQTIIRDIPIGRFVQPRELGDLAAFLASPLAAAITGINIPVDGGRLHTH